MKRWADFTPSATVAQETYWPATPTPMGILENSNFNFATIMQQQAPNESYTTQEYNARMNARLNGEMVPSFSNVGQLEPGQVGHHVLSAALAPGMLDAVSNEMHEAMVVKNTFVELDEGSSSLSPSNYRSGYSDGVKSEPLSQFMSRANSEKPDSAANFSALQGMPMQQPTMIMGAPQPVMMMQQTQQLGQPVQMMQGYGGPASMVPMQQGGMLTMTMQLPVQQQVPMQMATRGYISAAAPVSQTAPQPATGSATAQPAQAATASSVVVPYEQRKSTPSEGSTLHGTGTCRPCAWFWKTQGCANGAACRHCHMCPEGELKNRKKDKVATLRTDQPRRR